MRALLTRLFKALGWINRKPGDIPPFPFAAFEDTPEAKAARQVRPGETREQARARLAKFRVQPPKTRNQ